MFLTLRYTHQLSLSNLLQSKKMRFTLGSEDVMTAAILGLC